MKTSQRYRLARLATELVTPERFGRITIDAADVVWTASTSPMLTLSYVVS